MTAFWSVFVEWWILTVPASLLIMALVVWRLIWLHDLMRELCTDDKGRLSQNKVWAHVAKAAATVVFVKQGIFVTPPPALESLSWFLLVYAGIVGGSELAAKAMNLKWGGNSHSQPPAPQPTPPGPGGPGSMPVGPYPSPSGPVGG